MRKIIHLTVLFWCFSLTFVCGQRKFWNDTPTSNKYTYHVGEGCNEEEARKNATRGVPINVNPPVIEKKGCHRKRCNGKRCKVLVAIPNTGTSNKDKPRRYMVHRRILSIIPIPFISYLKEGVTVPNVASRLGTFVCLGAAAYYQSEKKDQYKLAKQAKSISQQEDYKQKGNDYRKIGNIFFYGFGTFLIGHVIHAFLRKSYVYAFSPQRKRKHQLVANYDFSSQTTQLGIRWQLGK